MENNIIEFHQVRDFSKKMSVTFEFVKQNFKSLSKALLFIAGPPMLIAGLLAGSFFGSFMSLSMSMGRGGDPQAMQDLFMSMNFWLEMILMFIFLMISGVVVVSTINNYLMLYEEKKTTQIEVNDVWDRVRASFWMYLGTMLLFGLLAFVVYLVMIIPVVLLAAISPFLIFFGIVVLLCVVMYAIVASSMVFIIRSYERLGFFEAIGRSFRLINGKWWSTFGLLMILYMIVMMVSYIFIMPWYITTIVSSLHDLSQDSYQEPESGSQILTMVSFALYYLAQMILYSLPNVGLAFQYFNLVERKEARGLMSQIQAIGDAPITTSTPEEDY